MQFYLYWRQRGYREKLDTVAELMGLAWSRKDLFKPDVRPDVETDRIVIPLSLILDPDLVNKLRTWMKDTRKGKGEIELGKLTREEFLEWYRHHTGMKT